MLKLDSRSWHALGIAVQDSFISKEKHEFDSSIPWREKPMKVNSVIDVHKIALDKLLLRLHRMYEAIGQATQATIDPLPRDEKVQTVMGKQEDFVSPLGGKVTSFSRSTTDASGASRDVVLPPLPESPPKSVTLMSMSPEPKQSSKKSTKYFPRQSTEWCEDIKSGHDMPRLVSFKPPPIHKKTSNVQSRYLGRKADKKDEKQFSLFRKDEWKPAAVKRLLGAMRAFDSIPSPRDKNTITVEEGTPRWKRLMELLEESGLKSPNQTIAMEAAKTVGQLNCRHPKVLLALSDTVNDLSKDPRVLYEASKALILLGNWSPEAMKIVIEHIKKGNELVVKELLDIMTKAKNIPFVDQSTLEFRSLQYLLIELVKVDYHPLSFRAAIGLGKLCVVEPVSKGFLVNRLATLTAEEKSEALLVLIKQMNCKDKYVLEVLLDHLCTAHNWKNRLQAAELLIFIGSRDLFSVLPPEKVFDVLERLLWDHSNKELRAKIAEVINVLGIRQPACSLILRRLEDPNEEVRARSVISLATLGMKGGREMKALLDILELDSSVYVRIQVIRAFSQLKWNDPRIIRSLRERDRGDSTLASEARKAVAKLTEDDRLQNTRQNNTIET
ncbi:protein HEATR9 [Exaiptasia diaphana]|uniref:Uncharacterized protein n=1 Tax=Exaiptasia diaphana TaxID=2652724 RepID=A0A913XJM0_EXADI|nr:protein HEATR9 [Exaiptasia diaphana]